MEEFNKFFLLLKDYVQIQKEHASLTAAESATRLLFALATGAIVSILVGIALLLSGFALAYWINETMGSTYIGFLVIAGVMLFLCLIFWLKRKTWVLQPVAKLMVRIFIESQPATQNTNTQNTTTNPAN